MADIETEREMSRAEVSEYLHAFAERFGGDGTRGGETSGEEPSASGTEADSAEAFVSDETDRTGESTPTEDGEKVTFTIGNESATVSPPETVEFGIAVDSTSGMLESGEHETVEFTLQWDAEASDEDGGLGLH